MRILGNIAKWLFIICLPLMLLTASIAWAINSSWLYEYGFEKYSISQKTGLAPSELDKAANGLIQYFNSDAQNINLTAVKDGRSFELFNQREVAHLYDVKGLIRLDYQILLGTLIYVLGFAGISLFWRRNRRQLARSIIAGSGLSLLLVLALGLGTLFNFDQLFLQFHLISFANELWQLDPTKDYLIMLFPGGFWYDVTMFCVMALVTGTVVLGGVSSWYLIAIRRRATS